MRGAWQVHGAQCEQRHALLSTFISRTSSVSRLVGVVVQ